jgi:lipooligosaccharide transport system permease protein
MRDTWKLSWHIVRRNWLVYRKDLIANVSPTLTDPAFLILSLGVGLGAFVAEVQGHTYLQYLAPGLAVSTAMFTAFFETSYGFFVRMTFENIFKAMLTTPIGVNEIVLGEFLWVSVKGALMVTGVSLVLTAFGLFSHPTSGLWLAPAVGVLVAFPLGCLGLLASCTVRNINQFQTVYSFLISPLYFFSGIFFPLEQMPGWLQAIAKALPLYHGVRLSQAIFWNENIGAVWAVHAPILLIYSAVLFALTFVKVRRRLQA